MEVQNSNRCVRTNTGTKHGI